MEQKLKGSNQRFILIGLILFLAVIIFREIQTYLGGFLAAIAMYTLLKGQMINMVEERNYSRGFSASIIVLGSIIFILIPLTGIGLLVADTISGIEVKPEEISDYINTFLSRIENLIGIEISQSNLSAIPMAGTSIMQTVVSGLSSMILNSIIAIFVLYFMLVSYDSFEKMLLESVPLNAENKSILRQEVKSIILSNAVGIPVVAIIQGILAYFGFLFLGVTNPHIYAVLISFATIVPVVGTALVWVPLSIAALVDGELVRGILLIAYGLIIIGGSDAVVRFVLQKRLANIHPLITFFGVLIGIAMFGFWGIIFGPLILSLFILLFNMYRHDYVEGSTAEPRVTTSEDYQSNILMRKSKKKSGPDLRL